MQTVKYEELDSEKVLNLVKTHKSFYILGLSGRMGSAVSKIENIIETSGLSCRVYTYGRVAASGATVFGGLTGVVGLASIVGIAAHNIATFNPDYEIVKHLIDNKLTIKYKK